MEVIMNASKTLSLSHQLIKLDIAGCRRLNTYCQSPAIQGFFSIVSRLGDGALWYALGLSLPVIYGWQGVSDLFTYTLTGLICVRLYKQLKKRLVRERPFIQHLDIMKGYETLDQYSFPSGHTMHAVCFSMLLIASFPAYAVIAIPFSILIAISRVVLGLHYPSDVVCGALFGAAIAFLGQFCLLPLFTN
jgi:undecaprenyl-diphosphatase